ncbi:MAG TPA: GGDEF domain-containing protein [Luteimonas sp.]|nr:GGDEF domain-containing protein [Luteimonas sp.]
MPALAYLLCHGAAILWFPANSRAPSFVFLIGAPLLAAAACLFRARRGLARSQWHALALGLLLWASGMAAIMHAEVFQANIDATPALGMLLFVLYGVPLTYALAGNENDSRKIRLVDGALALALGGLFTVHTFASANWTGADEAGFVRLRTMFDIENAFIAVFSLLGALVAESASRRRFFRSMAVFAVTYGAVAGYVNHVDTSQYGELVDLIIDVPFLVLTTVAGQKAGPDRPIRLPGTIARVVRTASPLILPAALLIVSASIAHDHLALAIAGFFVATLGYGARSVLLQLRGIEERERLNELARLDALTGLDNRRQFDDTLLREWHRAKRIDEGLSVLLIDIDHFKRINDTYGHPAGDLYLREVAQTLARCATRASDAIARYGGEEFAVVLPGASLDQARRIAQRMRIEVEDLRLASPAAGGVVTVSVGIGAAERIAGADPAPLLRAADQALYEAKRGGRNRVAWIEATMPPPLN